jgi:hypothetical protein
VGEFDVIEPPARSATFNGRQITVAPLKVGQLPAFARAIKPISGAVEAIATGRAALTVEAMLDIIADHGEAIIDAVALASGVSVAELSESTPDQLIELAAVCLEVNADFFARRLTPAIRAAGQAVRAPAAGAGPTP